MSHLCVDTGQCSPQKKHIVYYKGVDAATQRGTDKHIAKDFTLKKNILSTTIAWPVSGLLLWLENYIWSFSEAPENRPHFAVVTPLI